MRIDEFTDRDAVPISPDRRKPRIEIAVSADLMAVSQCDNAAAISAVHSAEAGLDATEAVERLRRFGPNQIARERRTGVLYELANRTKNPLNALLLTLAVVSYFLGDVRAAMIIAAMVVLSIATAFIQEHRSNQAAAKLRALVKTTASVKRPGDLSHPSKVEGLSSPPWRRLSPVTSLLSRPAT